MNQAEDQTRPQCDLALAQFVVAQHRHPDAAEHALLTPPDELGRDEQHEHEQPALLGEGAVVDADEDRHQQDDRHAPHPAVHRPVVPEHRTPPPEGRDHAVGERQRQPSGITMVTTTPPRVVTVPSSPLQSAMK